MLTLKFVNQSNVPDDHVYITPYTDPGNACDILVKGTPFPEKKSMTLADIGDGGVQINKLEAGRFYVSYGKEWSITADKTQPSAVDPSDAWFSTQWDKFEITMNGGNGDQANLTSIDFVGIPMRMESHYVDGGLAQSIGYPDNNRIIARLSEANASAVISGSDGSTTRTVRVIGPSQSGYPSTGGWPTFGTYLKALSDAKQQTHIAFQTSHSVDNDKNWQYTYDFIATVDSSLAIQMTGTIVATNTVGAAGKPIPSDVLQVAFKADDGTGSFLSSFVYAGAGNVDSGGNSNVVFTGNWDGFFAKTTVDAELDVKKRIIGDLAVGFAYGFAGSERFKNAPSGDWFAEKQKAVLAELQPDNPFYSIYENLVFEESCRTVYGHPYSDRLSAYHVAVDSVLHENKSIGDLVVTLLP